MNKNRYISLLLNNFCIMNGFDCFRPIMSFVFVCAKIKPDFFIMATPVKSVTEWDKLRINKFSFKFDQLLKLIQTKLGQTAKGLP